ncbi:MAG: glycosyltransferase family 25 protein [FCB group bacterium]|nr:glycosyltransferase family 25 protein [FCB group bacterium]MBL7029529.1 glycosyltransferase family 25 protein [Candidatus Neomarinimicrobiota bacterium]MBL7121855.1 glycosyltransferase family 25 protein [Candidatus Neomarinimicrobiota bacterium]
MHYDKAYLISLERSPIRRKNFYRYAKKAGLEVEWFPALYGLDVNTDDYQKRGYLSEDFKLRLAGSLGTLLSHVHVWEKIADDPQCEVGLVFEDDAVFNRRFLTDLSAIKRSDVPEDWDMLWLGWHKLDCDPVNEIIGTPRKTEGKSVNSGHFAYMVKSSSVDKLKALLLPYDNSRSKDVLLRQNFEAFNAYFLLEKIVKTPMIGFDSVRKNINDPNRIEGRPIKKLVQKIRKLFLE